jgi:hypothetical protein
MRLVRRRLREFYVGSLRRRNSEEVGLVVFTATDQFGATSDNYARLYECAENTVSEFHKDTVRPLIGSPDGFSDAAIQQAVDQYCVAAGIDPEAEWREVQSQEAEIRSRHLAYLQSVGMLAQGSRRVSRRHRTTPCHCHQAYLDNSIHMECGGCGGIICYACGGCLCGR